MMSVCWSWIARKDNMIWTYGFVSQNKMYDSGLAWVAFPHSLFHFTKKHLPAKLASIVECKRTTAIVFSEAKRGSGEISHRDAHWQWIVHKSYFLFFTSYSGVDSKTGVLLKPSWVGPIIAKVWSTAKGVDEKTKRWFASTLSPGSHDTNAL